MLLKITKLGLLASVMAIGYALPASADIIFDTSISTVGTGFGAVPRMLTVEYTGSPGANPLGLENGCVGVSGGATALNQCSTVDATIDPNGYVVPNSNDLENGGGGKNAYVSLSGAGITNANQIVLIYNPSQQGASPATDIVDITLKFYNTSGAIVASVDGGCGSGNGTVAGDSLANCQFNSNDALFFTNTGTNLGNGGTGFALDLTSSEASAVDMACGMTTTSLGNCTGIALQSTIALANDGPDSFYLFSRSQVVPEPLTLSLFGAGLVGVTVLRRRKPKA